MARSTRLRRLQALNISIGSHSTQHRPTFAAARGISSTCAARGKNTDWVRGKLWKGGEAPGPADPYTQRAEPPEEAAAASNLPEEAHRFRARSASRSPAAVESTRLVLPARRSEAPTEKEVKELDASYEPAVAMEGLEEIGTLKSWWDQPGHWGEESDFKGFGMKDRVVDREVLEVHLRRAVVEALSLQQTGAFSEWSTKRWQEGPVDEALSAEIQVQDGKGVLQGNVTSIADALTTSQASEETEPMEPITVEQARGLVKSWDPSWKTIALDTELRFALRKRLYQLTGILVPDAKLAAAKRVKHVLTLAGLDPKPPRLAELLERQAMFGQLPNVTVHSRKIGAIDKEVAVGRWKVIVEELEKRDLPVTGVGNLRRNKERDWLNGKS